MEIIKVNQSQSVLLSFISLIVQTLFSILAIFALNQTILTDFFARSVRKISKVRNCWYVKVNQSQSILLSFIFLIVQTQFSILVQLNFKVMCKVTKGEPDIIFRKREHLSPCEPTSVSVTALWLLSPLWLKSLDRPVSASLFLARHG